MAYRPGASAGADDMEDEGSIDLEFAATGAHLTGDPATADPGHQEGAAVALAAYQENIWLNDLEEYSEHDIKIDIDVEENTSGVSRELDVWIDNDDDADEDDFDAICDLERDVRRVLTDENIIWERFCASDEAKEYLEE